MSGGSYVTTLPRTYLQDPVLGRVARTIDTALMSTQVDINLTRSRQVRIVSVINHNLSLSAKRRLRGATDATFTDVRYDSGWGDVWPEVYPYPVLEWEDDRWWSGKYSAEQLSGAYHTLVVILPNTVTSQYWRLEFDDTTNPAGYVQAGRIFIGPAWQPTKNPSFGLTDAWETKTSSQTALGGTKFFQRRVPSRFTQLKLDYLPEDEALSYAFDLDRLAGIDKEIFWVHDPDDTVHAIRRQYLGRLRQLTALEYPYHLERGKPYQIEEIL